MSRYLGPIGIPLAVLVVILLALGWWYGRKLGDAAEDAIEASEQPGATKAR